MAVQTGCAGPDPGASAREASVVELTTQPPVPADETPPPCAAALIEGQLVADAESGLGVIGPDGPLHVLWPNGYYARQVADEIVLVDPEGHDVGRVGDSVRLGGGQWGRDGWRVCELVERVPGGSGRQMPFVLTSNHRGP